MTAKKILIFGMPRTGTTVLQKQLAKHMNVLCYNEPFTDSKFLNSIGDPYQWANNLSTGVVKVLAQNLDSIDLLKLITQGGFDSVIVTQRQNLTDICASLYYAERVVRQYHYKDKPTSVEAFEIAEEFISGFLLAYKWFQDSVKQLKDYSIPYTVFDYDQYQQGITQAIHAVKFNKDSCDVDSVSADIDYSQICVNYQLIKLLLNHANNY